MSTRILIIYFFNRTTLLSYQEKRKDAIEESLLRYLVLKTIYLRKMKFKTLFPFNELLHSGKRKILLRIVKTLSLMKLITHLIKSSLVSIIQSY